MAHRWASRQCSISVSAALLSCTVGSLAYSSSHADAAPSASKRIVVKMGGSAITVKSKLETLNAATLDATAAHVAAAHASGVNLAVLHGAGSFGHFQAKKYLISKGNAHPEWAFGFADTRRAVTTLNHEVVTRLVGAKVPAVGVSPFPSCWTSRKGYVQPCNIANPTAFGHSSSD